MVHAKCVRVRQSFSLHSLKSTEHATGNPAYNILLTFSKVFAKVPYQHIFTRPNQHGVSGTTFGWIRDFLRHRIHWSFAQEGHSLSLLDVLSCWGRSCFLPTSMTPRSTPLQLPGCLLTIAWSTDKSGTRVMPTPFNMTLQFWRNGSTGSQYTVTSPTCVPASLDQLEWYSLQHQHTKHRLVLPKPPSQHLSSEVHILHTNGYQYQGLSLLSLV